MSTRPAEFLKTADWTNAFYDGIICSHKKIDEMDSCLEEIRQLHAESLAVPGLQRPPRWRELDENVLKFDTLHDAVVDLVNAAFDALSTCWEDNDEDYGNKYVQAKSLRQRFEKTAEAFNVERVDFRKKAWAKIANPLVGLLPPGVARPSSDRDNSVEQKQVTGDLPTTSAAVNAISKPEWRAYYNYVAPNAKSDKCVTPNVVEDGQSVPKEKKQSSKTFVCDLCTKRLGTEQGLNDHKKDAHGVPSKPSPSASKKVMDEYYRQLGIYCQQEMDKLQTE
ncbi:hypothetical protein AAVH_24503 [Aphelenchoides avenae]|nr:hypothetical protein AAVH_24503 [Aphelenchus avenae]